MLLAKSNNKKGKPRQDMNRSYSSHIGPNPSAIPHRSEIGSSSMPIGRYGGEPISPFSSLDESYPTYHGGNIMYQTDGSSQYIVQNHGKL